MRPWGPFSVPSACTPCGGCVLRGGSVAFVCRGAGWGGGGGRGARALYPPFLRPGGACRAGGRSASFRPSAFPRQATKRVSLASCCPWGAWPPIPLRFMLARLHWARSVRRPGALARAHLFTATPMGAGGWGGGAGRAPVLLSGGGGGPSPLPRGVGAGAPAACGPMGGVGGGSRRGLPAPLRGGGLRYSILAPLVSWAHSPLACACGRGRGAALGWGGVRGGPWTAPLGAPADLNPPSALPEWAVVTGGSCRVRPPYCSAAPPCAAPKLGARVAPARWFWARPAAATPAGAGGWGRWGARCAGPAASPLPASRSLLGGGGGGRPLGSGGAESRSCGSRAGGGERGGGWGGRHPAPPPPRPVGRQPAIRCLRRAPPGYTRAVGVAGRPRASGAVRSAADGPVRRGGGGGATPPPWFAPPSSPGRPLIGLLRLRRPGRRRPAVGRQRAGRAGACLGRGAPAPRVQRPLRGGCGAAVSSVCLRPLLGLSGRGGGSGGGPLVPRRRLLPAGRGGGMAVPAPGASHWLGGRTLPPPPST